MRSIVGMKPFHITALGMNYVPQLDHVFPSMSVQQNLEVGGMVQRRVAGRLNDQGARAFPTLPTIRRDRAATLSGGQQRMLAPPAYRGTF